MKPARGFIPLLILGIVAIIAIVAAGTYYVSTRHALAPAQTVATTTASTQSTPSATIDQSSLSASSGNNVAITGSATIDANTDAVRLLVTQQGQTVYESGRYGVSSGRWTITIVPTLVPGSYILSLLDNESDVLANGTLTVTVPTNSGPLFSFSSPAGGAQLTTNGPATIAWSSLDPNFTKEFPDLTFQLYFQDQGGDEAPITQTVLPLTQDAYQWDVAQAVQSSPPFFTPGKKFQIVADLVYTGSAPFTCDPTVKGECDPIYADPIQSEIDAAKQRVSYSGWFTVEVSPQTAALSCSISATPSSVQPGQSFLLNWNSVNTQIGQVTGAGVNTQVDVTTWGDDRITLSTPGTYSYSFTGQGYVTNPGSTTCTTTVVVGSR